MPITRHAIHTSVSMSSSGQINFHQVLMLTFTIASEGRMRPVGVMKPMIPIPNKYAFTISRPGTFTSIASEPMIGIVSTAMPDEDEINKVNSTKSSSIIKINNAGGMVLTSCAAYYTMESLICPSFRIRVTPRATPTIKATLSRLSQPFINC